MSMSERGERDIICSSRIPAEAVSLEASIDGHPFLTSKISTAIVTVRKHMIDVAFTWPSDKSNSAVTRLGGPAVSSGRKRNNPETTILNVA